MYYLIYLISLIKTKHKSSALLRFQKHFLRGYLTKDNQIELLELKDGNLSHKSILTEDNVKIDYFLVEPEETNDETEYIIFLHGVYCNRKKALTNFELHSLTKFNIVVLIPDYRSFGNSTEVFDVEKNNSDIEALYKHVINRFDKEPHLIGHSFGGGVALEFAKHIKHKRKIILVSTFTSVWDATYDFKICRFFSYFFPNLVSDIKKHFNYNNLKNIMFFDKDNVLLIHGKKDVVISTDHSEKLEKACGCKLIRNEKRDHNSVFLEPNNISEINNFIRGIVAEN